MVRHELVDDVVAGLPVDGRDRDDDDFFLRMLAKGVDVLVQLTDHGLRKQVGSVRHVAGGRAQHQHHALRVQRPVRQLFQERLAQQGFVPGRDDGGPYVVDGDRAHGQRLQGVAGGADAGAVGGDGNAVGEAIGAVEGPLLLQLVGRRLGQDHVRGAGIHHEVEVERPVDRDRDVIHAAFLAERNLLRPCQPGHQTQQQPQPHPP